MKLNDTLGVAGTVKDSLHVALGDAPYRKCEFCGCNTNAQVRACCERGKAADGVTLGAPQSKEGQD